MPLGARAHLGHIVMPTNANYADYGSLATVGKHRAVTQVHVVKPGKREGANSALSTESPPTQYRGG